MVGELIMLPVRFGVRATRLWLRAAEETVNVAANATGRLIGMTSPGSGDRPADGIATEERPPPPPAINGRSASSRGQRSADTTSIEREVSVALRQPSEETAPVPPSSLDTPVEPEPDHVSEEPSLVEEFSEPGAEDGAGAEVHIEPPWEGYPQMNAKQIVDRLSSADPAELAAVQLYESTHRNRQTILNAAQRQLRSANGRSA